jgi:hypothetical protein
MQHGVKPIVEDIFKLQTTDLDSMRQLILATWSVKNAMVFEALRPTHSWFFLDAEREALMKNLQMPSWTQVWIAKCINHEGIFTSGADLGGVTNASSV